MKTNKYIYIYAERITKWKKFVFCLELIFFSLKPNWKQPGWAKLNNNCRFAKVLTVFMQFSHAIQEHIVCVSSNSPLSSAVLLDFIVFIVQHFLTSGQLDWKSEMEKNMYLFS